MVLVTVNTLATIVVAVVAFGIPVLFTPYGAFGGAGWGNNFRSRLAPSLRPPATTLLPARLQ